MDSMPPLKTSRTVPEPRKLERAAWRWVGRAWWAPLWLGLTLGVAGCTKRVPVSATQTNIADGRTFDIELTGDRHVHGKLTKGSVVRYEQGDSLFDAEVDEVTDEFIELSRRELVADGYDMTRV